VAGRPLHHLVADHADDWPPPFRGVAYDDRAVVDALLAVLHRHDDPSEAMRAAVRLGGGGTALLGAVVGGILGCRRPTAIDRVPWRDRVTLPADAALDAAVAGLAAGS
jgi:ADP-ribosylglycohydrolase